MSYDELYIVYTIQAIVIIDGLTMIIFFYFTTPDKKILHKQNILLSINKFLKVKNKYF